MDTKEKNKEATQTAPIKLEVKVPEGTNVLYCDSAFITASNFGIVFDFAQSMASTNSQTVVSRIGMSRNHAEAMLKVLEQKIVEMQAMDK